MRSSAGMLLLAGFIMAFTALPTSAVAQEQPLASAEALLDAAARQSAGIASLNAEFVQEKSMAVLARPMTSQGYFCLRRGVQASSVQERATSKDANGFQPADSLLWAYTRPLASGFIYKNGKGALWEGSPEATRPANERESTVITAIIRNILDWISIDPAALRATYRLERPQADKPMLQLYPLRQSFFAKLEVTFADDLKSVSQLSFTERNGDTVRIIFKQTRVNEALPAPCAVLEVAGSDGQ
ncbi:outer membrane lipoprotein carrier protein LolA [Desulfovibrio desulfuricans]|uniref:outer membrane lipoprotein carrier protein LolA n=1 Tax=Desulfovibrio desulfuricans TaxID=876 RepID=UPI001781D25D|nr:outer membrane lipoprotein carrier protein LolA [Desulfovibrio desulfuricans]MBD8894981.1 outer membrane lipoprotein carrier protein LolA [Desulfovibrio desulfuricans]UIA99436.1 outer membrane lipoprotein carrier protein LolA [Desulfovibrio desulfuricans]